MNGTESRPTIYEATVSTALVKGSRPRASGQVETKLSWEVSLPIYSKMTDEDIEDVIAAVLDIVEKNAG